MWCVLPWAVMKDLKWGITCYRIYFIYYLFVRDQLAKLSLSLKMYILFAKLKIMSKMICVVTKYWLYKAAIECIMSVLVITCIIISVFFFKLAVSRRTVSECCILFRASSREIKYRLFWRKRVKCLNADWMCGKTTLLCARRVYADWRCFCARRVSANWCYLCCRSTRRCARRNNGSSRHLATTMVWAGSPTPS